MGYKTTIDKTAPFHRSVIVNGAQNYLVNGKKYAIETFSCYVNTEADIHKSGQVIFYEIILLSILTYINFFVIFGMVLEEITDKV